MGLTTVVKPDTMPHLLVVPHLHQIGPSHIFFSFPKRAFTGTVLDITVNKRMEREKIKRDTTSSTTSIGEPERLALKIEEAAECGLTWGPLVIGQIYGDKG
jgi:hypothetical protein